MLDAFICLSCNGKNHHKTCIHNIQMRAWQNINNWHSVNKHWQTKRVYWYMCNCSTNLDPFRIIVTKQKEVILRMQSGYKSEVSNWCHTYTINMWRGGPVITVSLDLISASVIFDDQSTSTPCEQVMVVA